MKKIRNPIYIMQRKSTLLKYNFVIGFMLFTLCSIAQQQKLTAIGNISGAPTDMKQSELKEVLMGERQRWKNGKRILIALMKTNTALGKTTSSKIYDMSGDELNKYWLSLVFQGKAQAPVFFTSVSELHDFVAQNTGAIGIVDKPIVNTDLRAVMIDGKSSF